MIPKVSFKTQPHQDSETFTVRSNRVCCSRGTKLPNLLLLESAVCHHCLWMRNRVWDKMWNGQVASLHAKFQSKVNIHGLWQFCCAITAARFWGSVVLVGSQYNTNVFFLLMIYGPVSVSFFFFFSGVLGRELESWACQASLTDNCLTGTRRRGICWLQYPDDQRKLITVGIDKEKWSKNITRPNMQTTDSWSQAWTYKCSNLDQHFFPSR